MSRIVPHFYFAPVYRDAERRLIASGLEWTILRCGLYSDFVLDHWLLQARDTGKLRLPVGLARIAPIARDDVAEALAVAAALDEGSGKLYLLTGSAALSFGEIAERASDVLGRNVQYLECSQEDYLRRARTELDNPWPQAFSSLCASIREGRYEGVTTDFERLVGRPADSFENFLTESADGVAPRNG